MMKSDWDLHLWHRLPGTSGNGYESLHRGNIPISKTQYKSPPLSLFLLLSRNTLIITLLIQSQKKNKSTHCTRLHPEMMIVSPLLCGSSASGHVTPETASQPATCRISPLINCRTDCFDTPPTPISLPPTIPDSIGSPERNQKEGEVQETWALLTLCWQKARTVLFTLTRELNKIMSMVIPVAGENLDPGQARHAHLPGMHKPIRRERK